MYNVIPPRPRRQLVAVGIQRGRDRITALLAPTLHIVREPNTPPRVEFLVPSAPVAA